MTSSDVMTRTKAVSEMIDTAMSLLNDGDRVPFFLQAHRTFSQGEPAASELVFNVPSDADFFGTRLNLYPEARIVSQSSPSAESDASFRPMDWTCVADSNAVVEGEYPISPKAVNCLFEIRGASGDCQSAPVSVLSAFSHRQGLPIWMSTRAGPLVSAYRGGLDFAVDEWIPRGSAWTVKVTPIFVSRPPAPVTYTYLGRFANTTASVVEKLEYRIRGVVTGYKRVRPFKTEAYPLTLAR